MTLLNNIGNTPLVRLQHISPNKEVSVWAKCEFLNPAGSIKDRVVAYIIEKAEREGHLRPGATLIENTSGNTGAAVAMIAALKGYKAILSLPDRVSQEKQLVLKALGADVRIAPSHVSIDSPLHYVNVAKQLCQVTPNSFYINQYNNLQNPEAHYATTGPEIWSQMQGNIDVFISVAGSGGTVSGIGRYLKEKNPKIRVLVVDPPGSVYYPYFKQGHLNNLDTDTQTKVEGAGEEHLVDAMDLSLVDDIFQFSDKEAFLMARRLAREEGLLVGGSSGANVWGAVQVAQCAKHPLNIVTLLPDHGMKYLSKFHNDQWMRDHNLL